MSIIIVCLGALFVYGDAGNLYYRDRLWSEGGACTIKTGKTTIDIKCKDGTRYQVPASQCSISTVRGK